MKNDISARKGRAKDFGKEGGTDRGKMEILLFYGKKINAKYRRLGKMRALLQREKPLSPVYLCRRLGYKRLQSAGEEGGGKSFCSEKKGGEHRSGP